MTLQALDLGLLWIAVVAAVAFPVRYWIGAVWWRNPLGWLLMSLAAIIILTYTKGVVTVLSGMPLKATPTNVVINGVVAAWLVAADFVIDHLIRKGNRERREAQARGQQDQTEGAPL